MDQAAEQPVTIFDLNSREDAKIEVRRLPGLARRAVRLIMAAGKREFMTSTSLQMISAAAVAVQLFVGRGALEALLASEGTGSNVGSVVPWAVGMAVVAGIGLFVSAVQREQQQILGELVTRHMQGSALDVAARVDLAAFERPDFHNRLQRVQAGVQQPLNMVFGLSGLVSALVGVAGVSVALVVIEPFLIPLILVVLLPAWMAASRRSSAFWRFIWRMTPRDRERGYIGQLLSGRDEAKEVRAFSLGAFLFDRWNRLYDERLAELRSVARRQLVYSLAATTVVGLMLGGIILLVAVMAGTQAVTLAEAGVAVAGIAIVGGRLAGAGWSASTLSEAGFYLDDYTQFLSLASSPTRSAAPLPGGFGEIRAESANFTYPSSSEPALTDVSIAIRRGEIVALVGENGSGKSTLAKLLAGLYQPDSGRITWDGANVSEFDAASFSQQVAVIFQDFIRYHLSASDNIGLGRFQDAANRHEVRAAATQAGADHFIDHLPAGFDTLLGPEFLGGVDLSIGQWQRIALARAFFRDAPFVILDEPTASLDAKAEHELFERIRTLLHDRTVLLISHRFSSVRVADRIYVLHEGRIVESGTHEELIAAGGKYAEMFTLQAEAYRT